MLQLFKKNSFALSFGDNELQALQLNEIGGLPAITAFNTVPLSAEMMKDGEILQKDRVLESIKTLLQKANPSAITANECLVSLPENQCYEYIFYISKELQGEEFKKALEKEISATVPLPLSELVYDFAVYEFRPIQVVFTVMARKRLLESYRELLKAVNIKISYGEPESLSLLRNLLCYEVLRTSFLIYFKQNTVTWYLLYTGLVFDSNSFRCEDPKILVKDLRTSLEAFTRTTGQHIKNIFVAGSPDQARNFIGELETFLPVQRCEKHQLHSPEFEGGLSNILFQDFVNGKFSPLLGCALHEFPKLDAVSKINLFKN